MKNIAIIGGGVMGLTAAFRLSENNENKITVYESEAEFGGKAASMDFSGIRTEKFYHFICMPDKAYIDIVSELGLTDHLKWGENKLSYFIDGKIQRFNSPAGLLLFKSLSLKAKINVIANVIKSKFIDQNIALENIPAMEWLLNNYGEEGYNVLWKSALELKFHQFTDEVSATWIYRRIKRVADSRRGGREMSGFLRNGTQELIDKLIVRGQNNGVEYNADYPVSKIHMDEDSNTWVVEGKGMSRNFDLVVSTAPLRILKKILQYSGGDKSKREYLSDIDKIKYVGLNCIVIKSKHPLTNNFWLNIKSAELPISGIIEYTNLNPYWAEGKFKLWYIPEYLPRDHERFGMNLDDIMSQYHPIFKSINPRYSEDWIVNAMLTSDDNAQPVCPIGFSQLVPPMETPFTGLYAADTIHFWPEDRTVSDAIDIGNRLAKTIDKSGQVG